MRFGFAEFAVWTLGRHWQFVEAAVASFVLVAAMHVLGCGLGFAKRLDDFSGVLLFKWGLPAARASKDGRSGWAVAMAVIGCWRQL